MRGTYRDSLMVLTSLNSLPEWKKHCTQTHGRDEPWDNPPAQVKPGHLLGEGGALEGWAWRKTSQGNISPPCQSMPIGPSSLESVASSVLQQRSLLAVTLNIQKPLAIVKCCYWMRSLDPEDRFSRRAEAGRPWVYIRLCYQLAKRVT